jgi:hypothetical protein
MMTSALRERAPSPRIEISAEQQTPGSYSPRLPSARLERKIYLDKLRGRTKEAQVCLYPHGETIC